MKARLHALLLLLPSALGLALAALALLVSVRDRVELAARWGAGFWLAVLALVACVAVELGWGGARLVALARGRWRPRGFAPLRMAFVTAVLAWVAYVAFLQPYLTYSLALTFALALGAFTAGWALLERRARGRAARVLDFALFQLCLVALLVELTLSVLGAAGVSNLFDHGELSARAHIDRYRDAPGLARYGFPCNSRGDYDVEPSTPPRAAPLVVCIGDSFSTGVVPHALHFTTVAEDRLAEQERPVEVYNMGVSAIGPREYEVLLAEQALPLEPDLVVIDVFVGNDLIQEQNLVGVGGALRRAFDRERLQTVLVARRFAALRREQQALGAQDDRVGELPGAQALRGMGEMSLEEVFRRLPWFEDPLKERPSFSVEMFDSLELSRARSICRPDASFEGLYERLASMHAAARAAGTPLAVMILPDELQVEDALWERLRSIAPQEDWRRDRIQRELSAWCAARDLPCLDLLPALRAVAPLEDGWRHVYHLRNTHLNARGNRAAGEALAEFLPGEL